MKKLFLSIATFLGLVVVGTLVYVLIVLKTNTNQIIPIDETVNYIPVQTQDNTQNDMRKKEDDKYALGEKIYNEEFKTCSSSKYYYYHVSAVNCVAGPSVDNYIVVDDFLNQFNFKSSYTSFESYTEPHVQCSMYYKLLSWDGDGYDSFSWYFSINDKFRQNLISSGIFKEGKFSHGCYSVTPVDEKLIPYITDQEYCQIDSDCKIAPGLWWVPEVRNNFQYLFHRATGCEEASCGYVDDKELNKQCRTNIQGAYCYANVKFSNARCVNSQCTAYESVESCDCYRVEPEAFGEELVCTTTPNKICDKVMTSTKSY